MASRDWTDDEQRSLDAALAAVAPSSDARTRWSAIAERVDGRSAKECLARYKEIRAALLSERAAPAPVPAPAKPSAAGGRSITQEPAFARLCPKAKELLVEAEPDVARASLARFSNGMDTGTGGADEQVTRSYDAPW